MTVAAERRIYLTESLQNLIDSRLDTIDRLLLGRVARAERMAIVRDVESQIHELLGEREADELSREDALAVLARLDPPEAFLAEDFESGERTEVRGPLHRAARPGKQNIGRASGILGLAALSLLLLFMLCYLAAILFQSETPVYVGAALSIPVMFICSILSITTGVYSRTSGVWALVGIVTGILALLLSLLIGILMILSL